MQIFAYFSPASASRLGGHFAFETLEAGHYLERKYSCAKTLLDFKGCGNMPPSEEKPIRIRKKRHSLLMGFRIANHARRATGKNFRDQDSYKNFLDGVSGDFPIKATSGVVLAACDEYYYRNFAVTLIVSIERHRVEERIHLHLCAPSSETLDHIDQLRRSLRFVSLTWTIDDCRLAKNLLYPTIYYAAARFLIVSSLMEATGAPVLCIDVDGLATKPVWPNYEAVRQGVDVLVIRRPEKRKLTRKILASAVGINNTRLGFDFSKRLSHLLSDVMSLPLKYHVDQISIYYLIRALSKRGLVVRDMPASFADHEFDPDSVLWTAKGWARKESKSYVTAKEEVESLYPSFHLVDPD